MKHVGTKNIETDRLLLRKFTIEDAKPMFNNWANDPEITEFLTWSPHKNIEETKDILATWIQGYENDEVYHWCITLKKDIKNPIGAIGAFSPDKDIKKITLGYCLGKNWWHQGIMTEALCAVIKFLFEEVHVNRIEGFHDVNNPHSGGVMKKCGMVYEGTLRESFLCGEKISTVAYYSILATDFFNTNTQLKS